MQLLVKNLAIGARLLKNQSLNGPEDPPKVRKPRSEGTASL